MTRTFKIGLVLIAIPFVLLLAACRQLIPPVTSTRAALVQQPTGTADLNWNPDALQLMVTIHMNGLTPSSAHPVHLYQGTCQNGESMLFSLHPVVANADGAASSSTVISGLVYGIPRAGWILTVQNSPSLAPTARFGPLACIALHNYTRMHGAFTLHYILAPTAADQNTSGQARLSVTAHSLTVTTLVHNQTSGSIHQKRRQLDAA